MLSVNMGVVTGQVGVVTSDEGGLSTEQIADMFLDKAIFVSDKAPDPIRQQAEAYRESLRQLVCSTIDFTRKQEKATIVHTLMVSGHEDLADIVRRL